MAARALSVKRISLRRKEQIGRARAEKKKGFEGERRDFAFAAISRDDLFDVGHSQAKP